MPRKPIKFNLDFMKKDIFSKFTVKQFDDVTFTITPIINNEPYNVSNMKGKIYVGINGEMYLQDTNITVSSNSIVVTLDKNMLASDGRAYAEIELTDNAGTVTSSSFIFDIDRKIGEGAIIPGAIEGFVEKYKKLTEEFKKKFQDCLNNVDDRFNILTSQQQQDSEVILARKGEVSLKAKIDKIDEQFNTIENEKTNYSYVDNKISQIVSGSPKGAYSTLTELNKNKPNGDVGIYITLDDNNWNYWNGSIWVKGGLYQATEVQDKSIDIRKTKYLMAEGIQSKNLFTEWELGSFDDSGIKTDTSTKIRSKYPIEVKSNTIYIISDPERVASSAANVQYIFEYDESYNFIKKTTVAPNTTCIFTTSNSTKYLNFLSQTKGTLSYEIGNYQTFKTQIELGNTFTGYENPNPKVFVKKGYIEENSVGVYETEYLMAEGTNSPNLFDGKLVYGGLSYGDGSDTVNDKILKSEFIKIQNKLSYKVFNGKVGDISHIFEYSNDYKFIKYTSIDKLEGTITLDVNTNFIKFRTQTSSTSYILPTIEFMALNVMICESDEVPTFFINNKPKVDGNNILPKSITKNHLSDEIMLPNSLPTYYDKESVIEKVYNNITSSKNSVFGLISDIQSDLNLDVTKNMIEHYTNINNLCKELPVSFIANTGDFINGSQPKTQTIKALRNYIKLVTESTPVPYFITKGNHDDNSYYAMGNGNKYDELITDEEWYKYVIKHFEKYTQFNFDNNNRKGGYCYFDDESSKIRYIFLNSYETKYIKNEDGTYKYDAMHTPAFSNEQLNWLAHKALNFEEKSNKNEWAVVGFCHYLHGATKNYNMLLDIILAYKKGIAYSYTSTIEDYNATVNVDFTNQGKGEFITFICGDSHRDWDFINLKEDLYLFTVLSSYYPAGAVERVQGTNTQDCANIVIINREDKTIKLVRFGGGLDRILNYDTYSPLYYVGQGGAK